MNRLAQGATIGAYTIMSAAAIVTLTALPAWHAENERADRAVAAAAAHENWAEVRDAMSDHAQDLADPVTPVTPDATPDVTPEPEPAPALTPEPIHEDDPGWDCHTMGNKVCGPDAAAIPAPAPGEQWQGFLVGEVIVCPPGWEVAVDTYPDGTTWASCQ